MQHNALNITSDNGGFLTRSGSKYQVGIGDDITAYYNEAGDFHRLDGPAIIHINGTELWFKDSQLHRLDGPAVMYHTGHKEYWIDGLKYTSCEYFTKTGYL